MTMPEARPPVAPGEPAPDFTLPAVDRNENVSLADYRGRSPVFLALMVGLWCPFCRQADRPDRDDRGQAEGARRRESRGGGDAARERPALLQVPPDPRAARVRSRSSPRTARTACPRPRRESGVHGGAGLDAHQSRPASFRRRSRSSSRRRRSLDLDGYAETKTDQTDMERQWPQLKGQFLIDSVTASVPLGEHRMCHRRASRASENFRRTEAILARRWRVIAPLDRSGRGSPAYRITRALIRLLLWLFYRRIDVVGRERIPESGGVIITANHHNLRSSTRC